MFREGKKKFKRFREHNPIANDFIEIMNSFFKKSSENNQKIRRKNITPKEISYFFGTSLAGFWSRLRDS